MDAIKKKSGIRGRTLFKGMKMKVVFIRIKPVFRQIIVAPSLPGQFTGEITLFLALPVVRTITKLAFAYIYQNIKIRTNTAPAEILEFNR